MAELAHVLRPLLAVEDPNALVDASTGDDAAVYRLSEDRALVVTVDFFTPIVDDPFDFGRIAAANALSDIYAMGARPLFALNLLGFPRALLGDGILEHILRGGAEIAQLAGIPILGGHSIDDAEPKFGMVVVGEVHPDRMGTNQGAKPGDVLVLTKPLGIGIVATAHKADAAPEPVLTAAVESMVTLNREAAEAAMNRGAHALTDVTGFGLLGHLRNLLRQSGVSAVIEADSVPVLDGARALLEEGFVPGGTRRNLTDLTADVRWSDQVDEATRLLLCDAQTSGGLLVALEPAAASQLQADLEGRAHRIGTVTEGAPGSVHVVP